MVGVDLGGVGKGVVYDQYSLYESLKELIKNLQIV